MALFAEFFGGKPKVPAFVPVDVQVEQERAIAGNEAALPALERTGSRINQYNQSELDKMLNVSFGGYYDKIRKSIGKNTAEMAAGMIPDDVRDAIGRNTAGRSLYGGYGGTGMARNLTARDLGLTSLDLMTKGLDSATRWMASARAPSFDVTSMFVRPEFQAQFAAQERDSKFQRDYIKNQWDWYSSFGQQAIRFEDTVVELASSVAGAMI